MKTAFLVIGLLAAHAARPREAATNVAPVQDPGVWEDNRRFSPDSMPWGVGERLEFRVKLGLFNIGRGALEVRGIENVRGVAVWHAEFTLSGGALGWDLVDTMQTFFGTNDMVTRRFIHNTDENGRKRNRTFEIFPERAQYTNSAGETLPTVESPLDDASFFFYARTLPLEVGKTYTIPRYFVSDRNPVQIRVIQKQTISVRAGRFPCIVVQPIFRSRGLFGQGGSALIWFSDDAARIPVRIRGSMAVGTLDMSLQSRR